MTRSATPSAPLSHLLRSCTIFRVFYLVECSFKKVERNSLLLMTQFMELCRKVVPCVFIAVCLPASVVSREAVPDIVSLVWGLLSHV